ncbi:gamma-glutamyl-gamma-aminobutyrate hydrolase family protein [Acidithiobacillus ferrianus]|uniref:gamma-glutamyl-gamma-aminobutyrate hydrolase family protein n=1 Tax=Acidithiobacillus ferrianus TaxID=2678518 RepID=UPI0034E55CED
MYPKIGVTTFGPALNACGCGCRGKTRPSHWLPSGYVQKIIGNGGIPVLLPPLPELHVDTIIKSLDGIVVTGGGDVSPKNYIKNEDTILLEVDRAHGIDTERDLFELALAKSCIANEVPYFGICRGMQILNVALNGTLHVDLSDDKKIPEDHRKPEFGGCIEHHVNILENTELLSIVESDRFIVMSNHHQSINQLGRDLSVTSISDDGSIEAIHHKSNHSIFGVQWHPEVEGPDQFYNDLIFRKFIGKCNVKERKVNLKKYFMIL